MLGFTLVRLYQWNLKVASVKRISNFSACRVPLSRAHLGSFVCFSALVDKSTSVVAGKVKGLQVAAG